MEHFVEMLRDWISFTGGLVWKKEHSFLHEPDYVRAHILLGATIPLLRHVIVLRHLYITQHSSIFLSQRRLAGAESSYIGSL